MCSRGNENLNEQKKNVTGAFFQIQGAVSHIGISELFFFFFF